MTKRLLSMMVALLGSVAMLWAAEDTYSPTLDVNFRTAAGNTAWNSGYPKSAADEGNKDFELTYTAGLFALQKYQVADLENATKMVLTLTVGSKSGVDAVRLWSIPVTAWNASTGVDDIVPAVTTATGIAPRATEGTANEPLVKGKKVTSSDPAKVTFTIEGTALATIKANATTEGVFTLLLTNDKLTDTSNKRSYLSINTENAEANRPTLVVTTTAPAPKTAKIGDTEYETLADAWAAAVAADADATIEVSGDQTLTARLTWNKAHTLNIVPTKDITIKGHKNGMWFLVNTNKGVLNIGSADHSITLDGQNNEMAYDVTKGENTTELTLTNVTFQNFNLNEVGHLVGSKAAQDVKITLDKMTFKNCTNPEKGFVNKLRVKNDMLILKGYLNQEGCTGTTIYSLGETKSSGTTGRIKIDDSAFTANSIITINFDGITKADGVVVVIGTSADNATKFALTDSEWSLARKSNGDLYMTAPATPTAKIGDTEYADLEAALAAVKDGETITLLADQEIKARVNIANMAVTINGGKTIKRATSYKGILFLTATGETPATLTLDGVTLDGQEVEATSADIEASNKGTVVLKDVTIKNNKTTASAAVVNKSGGKLELKGNVAVPSVFIGKNLVITAADATIASPITLVTDDGQSYKLLVEDGAAKDYTCASFRLSQQQDGVYAMPLPVAGSYTHPALLHTATDIATAKGRLDQEPFKSAYAALETASAGTAAGAVEYLKRMDKKNWESKYADYNNYTRAATDAKLAYELALRYQLKGSDASATAAVNILNNWATTNKGFLRLKGYANNIPDPNEYLMTIQAYQFANAAELLRDYSGWTADSQTAFKNWIRQTFADVAILFLENHHNNSNALHYWLNWDLGALSAMISVGVLCDDKALVDYALSYVDNGAGTGNKANAVVATHNDPDSSEQLAQCQESGRDQGHSTLDVTLMGVLCQTAQNNGADLFTPYKALEMAEYVGKYNLKDANGSFVYTSDKVPFTTYSNGEVEHTAISEEARGTERPCWELFHAYAKKNSKADAYTEAWVNYYRAKNAGGETTSSATDELGFGTLMFGAETSPTGIGTVKVQTTADGVYYNLQGQRVDNPTKGIYIVNGKKVIVK